MNRVASALVIPCPVFSNLYTKNSVSLSKSMEKVPGSTPVWASQVSLPIPAFQQCSGTLRSCSRVISESLNTLTYRQNVSCKQYSSSPANDPVGPSALQWGGSPVVSCGHVTVSVCSGWRSAGSRSPTTWASTGATFYIPCLESISASHSDITSDRFGRASSENVQTR